jgi:hypothetical protein
MKHANLILTLALALGACSNRSTPQPPAGPAAPATPSAATAPATPAAGAPSSQAGPAVQTAQGRPPASASDPSQGASLKSSYPDKAALLADVQKIRPAMAVELDGQTVAPGFGPAMRYHTAKDGSISRQ